MNTANRYEEVLEDVSLQERQVAALERIAEALEGLAADRRYERLSDVLGGLDQLREHAPSCDTPERARLRQVYRAGTKTALAAATAPGCRVPGCISPNPKISR